MYPLPEEHFGLTDLNWIRTCIQRTALNIKIKPFPWLSSVHSTWSILKNLFKKIWRIRIIQHLFEKSWVFNPLSRQLSRCRSPLEKQGVKLNRIIMLIFRYYLIKIIFLLKYFLLAILDTKYQIIQINLLNLSIKLIKTPRNHRCFF